MTTTKACQGTGVSGWERARVWDWVWARVGVRVVNGLPQTLTQPVKELGFKVGFGFGVRGDEVQEGEVEGTE